MVIQCFFPLMAMRFIPFETNKTLEFGNPDCEAFVKNNSRNSEKVEKMF